MSYRTWCDCIYELPFICWLWTLLYSLVLPTSIYTSPKYQSKIPDLWHRGMGLRLWLCWSSTQLTNCRTEHVSDHSWSSVARDFVSNSDSRAANWRTAQPCDASKIFQVELSLLQWYLTVVCRVFFRMYVVCASFGRWYVVRSVRMYVDGAARQNNPEFGSSVRG